MSILSTRLSSVGVREYFSLLIYYIFSKSAHLCICEQCSKELKQYGPVSYPIC